MICLNCGKEIHKNKFCSRSCSTTYYNKKHPKRRRTNICSECDKLIAKAAITCSVSCLNLRKSRLRKKLMEQSSIQEKVCPLCKKTKPLDSFYARKNGNAVGYCCDCVSKSRAERNKTWKNDIVAYMGGKCHFCGYNKCAAALELHHKHDKSFGISKKRLGIYDMVDELKKCILICANCHRELHYQNE